MDEKDRAFWCSPCGHGCIVGKPRGTATNGACKHARELKSYTVYELRSVLGFVLRDRKMQAETIRRFQRNEAIESDYIDPQDPLC